MSMVPGRRSDHGQKGQGLLFYEYSKTFDVESLETSWQLRKAKISDVLVDDYPLLFHQKKAFQKWRAGEESVMIREEDDKLLYIESNGRDTMKFSVAKETTEREETNVKRRRVVAFVEEEDEEMEEEDDEEVKEYGQRRKHNQNNNDSGSSWLVDENLVHLHVPVPINGYNEGR